jgi:Pyridoxamine 5'-phosphate oxidase
MATRTTTLTDSQRAFLEQPFYGAVTTLRSDGSPHTTVVWVDVDDEIDKLAKKYLGKDEYPWRKPEDQRINIRIRPEHVDSYGFDR